MADIPSGKPFSISTAGLIVRENRVLLSRRADTCRHFAGWWEFPGGKVDEGELFDQALKREVTEELGVEVNLTGRRFYDYLELEDRILLVLAFECYIKSGEVSSGEDVDGVNWVDRKTLAGTEMVPSDARIRDWVLNDILKD